MIDKIVWERASERARAAKDSRKGEGAHALRAGASSVVLTTAYEAPDIATVDERYGLSGRTSSPAGRAELSA